MKNKKGFTLIELIATIVILGIVASIGSYAITEIIKSSKEKNYQLLVENIETAAEMLYQDCKYVTGPSSDTGNECHFYGTSPNDYLQVSLSKLITAGFLSSNKTKEQTGVLYNPKEDNKEISGCIIQIKKVSGKIKVTSASSDSYCPTFG